MHKIGNAALYLPLLNMGIELKNKQRLFLSLFFFLSGFSFATWASRIPTIKANFGYNDAELGTVLLAMPISSLAGLPLSGWLISKFDSRIPLTAAFFGQVTALIGISLASSTITLVASLCLFAFSMRILNISMNTQAITIQKLFDKKINGSFHGLWSTGGIAGVGFSTLLVAKEVSLHTHYLIVAVLILLITLLASGYLIKNDRSPTGNKLALKKPDPYIVCLGFLVFFAALCEGGMFDWSGIYFKEIVHVDVFTAGYFVFMFFMAASRFVSDYLVQLIGMPKMYIMSSVLVISGITIAVVYPTFWVAMTGFSMVGFGAASIIPMTYTLAGHSKKYSTGIAISIISTYSTAGMLIGPPLLGYVAHSFGLRTSFVIIALTGFMQIPVSQWLFRKVVH